MSQPTNLATPEHISPLITDLETPAKRPRYLVFCVGLEREIVHQIRNVYQTFTSQSSPLLTAPTGGYEVKIIGFYGRHLSTIFNQLRLSPNLLILGPELQAPYEQFIKDWIEDRHPSVMRIGDEDLDPTQLPHEEYYLRTYSVISSKHTANSWRISNEIDYGILVNLNWRRQIKIEDFDNHVIKLDDLELDSNIDDSNVDLIQSMRETSFFIRPDVKVSVAASALVVNFFAAGTR